MDDLNSQLSTSLFDYNFPEEENDFSEDESEERELTGSNSEIVKENADAFEKYHSGL